MKPDHFDVWADDAPGYCDGRHQFSMIPSYERRGGYIWQCTECGAMT